MFGRNRENPADKVDLAAYMEATVKARMLEEENARLHKQVEKLQEALIAATAAKAYESMQSAKFNIETKLTPEQEEKLKKQKEEGEFWSKFIEYQEKPLFSDADELVHSLGRNIEVSVGDEPLHPGNSES